MNYAYLRISTEKQSLMNQKFEILNYADKKKIKIDMWIEETISSGKRLEERKISNVISDMQKDDILFVSELSRLGRNLMEVMEILNVCMKKEAKVFTIKENYELGDNINSKVLAFAFGLSAEIERQLISQRTKEALARVKAEGKKLGRPKGSLSKETKLTGKENEIKELLDKKISYSAIGRLLGVNRITVKSFIDSQNLNTESKNITYVSI